LPVRLSDGGLFPVRAHVDVPAAARRIPHFAIAGSRIYQPFEHGFSVRPSGNFAVALPHASSNCVWVKFWALLSLAPLRLAIAQEGAGRTEQRQKTKGGRAEECQSNASDLRGILIPRLA
jgi:hypothetical protein